MNKRYRIEDMLHGASPVSSPDPETADVLSPVAKEMADVLSTLKELRQILEPGRSTGLAALEMSRQELGEVHQLRAELDAMKQAITETRQEIASIYGRPGAPKGVQGAASELDAVIGATAQATTAILDAAEEIEAHASMLRASSSSLGNNDCLGAILDRVVTLYEACNFQDVTGQRISRIVGVLNFVEERLDAVTALLGEKAAVKDLPAREAGARLVAAGGRRPRPVPVRRDEGPVSQAEIDALFD